jgi:hypothetical protein
MSINDPVVLVCQPAHDLPYYLIRGRETFYDKETRAHLRWLTMFEAAQWCKENLGVTPYDHLPEAAQERAKAEQDEWEKSGQPEQPRLL